MDISALTYYQGSKRTGLDKAIYQIEEAIKKSKSDSFSNEGTLEQLQQLLHEARGGITEGTESVSSNGAIFAGERDGAGQSSDDQLALDDAENPLQLLARASDLRLTSTPPNVFTPSSGIHTSDKDDQVDVHRFFLPIKDRLDQSPDLDPIDLGLLSLEEAEMLISLYVFSLDMVFLSQSNFYSFHEKLAHTRWGLDPLIHTLTFVRSRSAFLFTSLLLASSRFITSTSSLAKRLLIHRKFLVGQIIARRCRSVEIVLALMVNIPWMHPLDYAADDDTGVFIAMALSISMDLSLNKIVRPSAAFDQDLLKRIPKADCVDAKKALAMDSFEDVEPQSEWGQRLLRRRERVWIALFVLERGVCLARGRNYCVPITPLIRHCDKWHSGPVSDTQDGPLISMAVLRRDLDDLFSAVRSRCDSYRVIDVGSKVAREIEATIDNFFNQWLATWTTAIGEGEQKILPPYVEILVTHTRLSAYSGVINHPTAPLEVKRQFRASSLSSALNVMRAAIQGEARLKSMPNNTVIMICFAACVALNLSTSSRGESHNLAPSVRNLIEETATVLERIGGTPIHRNGTSVIYGKYLRELVKQAPTIERPRPVPSGNIITQPATADTHVYVPPAEPITTFGQSQYPLPNPWGETLQFSAMSGNQVIETVLNAGDFESPFFDIPMDDANTFGWMDWMNPPDFGFQ